jgi:hypothetical protein
MPGIDLIQDVVSSPGNQYPIGDLLVKAPVPCFMTLTVNVSASTTDPTQNVTTIQQTAAAAVNGVGFQGQIPVSVIVSAVHSVLLGSASASSVVLQGRIRQPNGVIVNLSSSTVLSIGTDFTDMVTGNIVGFFVNPSDVTVNVTVG